MNKEDIDEALKKIDRKALAGAIGLMLMSWAALPIVYWLILRKKGGESKKDGKNNK